MTYIFVLSLLSEGDGDSSKIKLFSRKNPGVSETSGVFEKKVFLTQEWRTLGWPPIIGS